MLLPHVFNPTLDLEGVSDDESDPFASVNSCLGELQLQHTVSNPY